MTLVDLWQGSKDQLRDKRVEQIITIAGDGKLGDGSSASIEFRGLLGRIPSELLARYAEECLADAFTGSGFALQDIINEIGRRLGFTVEDGRYRGARGRVGHDGLWRFPHEHAVVVEVKTTDAYRIKVDQIARYRNSLIEGEAISESNSSVLVIVGRQDTGELEAQIRGSRHAWDVRLLSVEALLRLMVLKESVEDPGLVQRIHDILIPREFTRLDEIVDILFSTAEEIQQEDSPGGEDESDEGGEQVRDRPAAFHAGCVGRIEGKFEVQLLKRSRVTYSSADGTVRLVCAVSKQHTRGGSVFYWFAYHPHQSEFLEKGNLAHVALGCGSEE